ncbi:hypothetical protein JAO84_02575 [Streptomyces fradiae]
MQIEGGLGRREEGGGRYGEGGRGQCRAQPRRRRQERGDAAGDRAWGVAQAQEGERAGRAAAAGVVLGGERGLADRAGDLAPVERRWRARRARRPSVRRCT